MLLKRLIKVNKFLFQCTNFYISPFSISISNKKRGDENKWDGNFLIKILQTFTCIAEIFTLNVKVFMHVVAGHSTMKCENDIKKCCKNFLYKTLENNSNKFFILDQQLELNFLWMRHKSSNIYTRLMLRKFWLLEFWL